MVNHLMDSNKLTGDLIGAAIEVYKVIYCHCPKGLAVRRIFFGKFFEQKRYPYKSAP